MDPRDRFMRWSTGAWWALPSFAGAAPGAAWVALEGIPAELVLAGPHGALVGAAAAGLAGGVGLGVARWRAGRLPLRISPEAVRGELGGRPVVWVRTWLGWGRAMRAPVATVVRGDGAPLPIVGGLPAVAVGPWTIAAWDDVDAQDRPLHVTVEVAEGRRAHRAERRWAADEVLPGRLSAPLRVADHGARWDRSAWSQRAVGANAPGTLGRRR